MPQMAAHEWFLPRLKALMSEADAAGYGRDVAVAVITDLVNGTAIGVDVGKVDENWATDIGEPPGQEREMPIGETPQAADAGTGAIVDAMPRVGGRGRLGSGSL